MKISVLTPSLNCVRYIERAIQSVLAQEYSNWEHIVMDGGSIDGTQEILEKYSHLIWESSKDHGQSDAMNKCLLRASGDVIIFLNADDELAKGTLAFVVEAFNRHPTADMIVSNFFMNISGKIIFRKPTTSLFASLNYWPARFPLNPVAYAYKKTLQTKIGLFPSDNHYAMDYWFLLRAFMIGRVVKAEFVGGTYNVDGMNKSMDVARSKKCLRAVRNEFIKAFWFRPSIILFVACTPFRIFTQTIRKVKRWVVTLR